MRPVTVFGVSAVAICLFLTTGVQAEVIHLTSAAKADPPPTATQGFIALSPSTANGSPNGNINTATTFTIGDWTSSFVNSGVLAGMPMQTFGTIPLNLNVGNSFTFGNSVFGTFQSSTILNQHGAPGFENVLISGAWTPGSFGGLMGQGPFPAQVSIAFTQIPPNNGSISVSGTFATPPFVEIPEPSTIVMALMGLVAGVGSSRLRRRSSR